MKNYKVERLILSGVFIAIGLLLPFATMYIPSMGKMLNPMHIPVFMAGLILGWKYGIFVGAIVPILRGFVFGMPVLFPTGFTMMFELLVYGAASAIIYGRCKKEWNEYCKLYISLISAMIIGRCVWGIVSLAVYSTMGKVFTWEMFFAAAVLGGIPGIVLHLLIIPELTKRIKNLMRI